MSNFSKRLNFTRNTILRCPGIRRVVHFLRGRSSAPVIPEVPVVEPDAVIMNQENPGITAQESSSLASETIQNGQNPFDQLYEPFCVKSGRAVRVLFVAQYPALWSNWRSVWHAMRDDPRFVAKIVVSPFLHPYSSAALTMDKMRRCLMDENIPFSTVEAFNIESFRPHVVFLQNPYDETRPEIFRSDRINQHGSRIAYIPYGLEMGGGAWGIAAQFDLSVQRLAWKIFARSERHRKMFAKYCRSGNSHVVVTGHPKFDSINYSSNALPPDDLLKKINGRRVVLWTPHFSVTEIPSWSTYRIFNDFIFSTAAERKDVFLLLRPHPMFFKSMLENGLWDDQGEARFRRKIIDSENIALDESADYHMAFNLSDGLMTDVGSFLLEYFATGRPLLYLHHPDGLGMNDDEALTKSLYVANSNQDIADFFNIVAKNLDPRKAQRDEVKEEYIFGLGTNIGAKVCESIFADLSAGDALSARALNEKSVAQQRSEEYWGNAAELSCCLLEDDQQKTKILAEELSGIPSPASAIDIGCGDGVFTLQLAKYAKRVHAYDISQSLIEKAKENAASAGVGNVNFFVQEVERIMPFERFDALFCLGVTACIIDDLKFIFFLQRLRSLAKTGAYLFLMDAVSTASEQSVEDESGFPQKCRSNEDYKMLACGAGFSLYKEIVIKESVEKKLVNKLFVMRAC